MPESSLVLDAYASRLQADVEANLVQQEQVRIELRKLKQEHAALAKMMMSLEAVAETAVRVPEQPTAARQGEALRPAPSSQPGTPRTPHAPRGEESSLIEIVCRLLREQNEPRSVAEIRNDVIAVRPTTEQTVRNTLDRLVATSKAERTRQGRSVFYSAVRPGTRAGSSEEREQAPTAQEP
ncbi:hypothetical protein ACWCXB_24060 [Streptomyces sp. NPDC001514]